MLWLDAYYFLWAYTLRYSVPRRTSEMVSNAIQGHIAQAKDFLLKELTKDPNQPSRDGEEERKGEEKGDGENKAEE